MEAIEQMFAKLTTDNAPGQEERQKTTDISLPLNGETLIGSAVDFSHGDVDAFKPSPGSYEAFVAGVRSGAVQAYTVYRGKECIRDYLSIALAEFTGSPVSANDGLIITPGTQGALFLALASCITRGDKVAIVQPDYFANRKLVVFLGAEVVPINLKYDSCHDRAGIDLDQLEHAFSTGTKAFVFSNPNNPVGVVYSKMEINAIAKLAQEYGATVIVDQLYSRLLFPGSDYYHLRSEEAAPDNLITIMGPSKTESLSGYRVGVAFGLPTLIERMEKLQAIVSLRAGGYSQAVLNTWFSEPAGWLAERIELHRIIRDSLIARLKSVDGLSVRTPQAGSYLFPRLPPLNCETSSFVSVLRQQAAVTVTTGAEFGPDSLNCVRLNFSQERSAAIDAVDRMCLLIERYRK